MDSNGASSGGVGPGSAGGTAIASSPGGPNQFAWGAPPLGANDQLRTSNSGNNPQQGPPMDIQQILQQQQVQLQIITSKCLKGCDLNLKRLLNRNNIKDKFIYNCRTNN